MNRSLSKKYTIWGYIFFIIGTVGIFDLATRNAVLEMYNIDVGYAVLGLFFALKYLVGASVASQITTYAGIIFGFAPILLAFGYFFFKKAKMIEDPNEENQKRLKRAKIITWVVAAIIGATVLLGMGFVIYNSFAAQSGAAASNSGVLPERAVVKIRCIVEQTSDIWQGSGVLISKEGLVLTNAHVIPSQTELGRFQQCWVDIPSTEINGDVETYRGQPIVLEQISETYDLALLRITGPNIDADGYAYGHWPREFPSFDLEKCSGDFRIGEEIMIYGFPAVSAFNLSATDGVITTIPNNYIFYTSAKIDAGNSGGLAINNQGCFVGIPVAVTGGVYEQYGVIIAARAVMDFLHEFNVGI